MHLIIYWSGPGHVWPRQSGHIQALNVKFDLTVHGFFFFPRAIDLIRPQHPTTPGPQLLHSGFILFVFQFFSKHHQKIFHFKAPYTSKASFQSSHLWTARLIQVKSTNVWEAVCHVHMLWLDEPIWTLQEGLLPRLEDLTFSLRTALRRWCLCAVTTPRNQCYIVEDKLASAIIVEIPSNTTLMGGLQGGKLARSAAYPSCLR